MNNEEVFFYRRRTLACLQETEMVGYIIVINGLSKPVLNIFITLLLFKMFNELLHYYVMAQSQSMILSVNTV
jgi:hypothetical protein